MGLFTNKKVHKWLDNLVWRLFLILFWTTVILGPIAIIWTCVCINWAPGEQIYTGYIYSANDDIGDATKGHLRFSENAGEDNQPSFCVKKADGQHIKELAGSGKKVRVTAPAGFVLSAPWDCGIPATVEVIEEEEN